MLFRVDDTEFERVPAASVSPEHRDMVRRLYGVLDRLPVDLRIAWVLRHVQEETVPSVAELCGWSLSTAKRRIQAAEERVTKRLDTTTQDAGSGR